MESKINSNLHAVRDVNDSAFDTAPSNGSRISKIGKFSNELRKRKVCRTAITYSMILWFNLQIGELLAPVLALPDWTLKFVMFIGFMGFPVVILLAWAFQITARGIELDVDIRKDETTVEKILDRVVSLLLLVLAFALTLLLAEQTLR